MTEKEEARYRYELVADSGYQSSMAGGITPEQHAAIVRILGNKDLGGSIDHESPACAQAAICQQLDITDELLVALERTARAATPARWRAGNCYDKPFIPAYEVICDVDDGACVILSGNQNFLDDAVRNVAHAAAADPATVLALIAALREARARVEQKPEAQLDACLSALEAECDALRKRCASIEAGIAALGGDVYEARD